MKRDVLFIDFNDSFSFNIIQKIVEAGYQPCRVSWDQVSKHKIKRASIILLGPGPGYFSDYKKLINEVKPFIGRKPFLGICLGHQILMSLTSDFKIRQLEKPLHGQSIELEATSPDFPIKIGQKTIFAQFYNSWAFFSDLLQNNAHVWQYQGMIVGYSSPEVISYQFHPESIGTECTNCLIRDSLDFLYNG